MIHTNPSVPNRPIDCSVRRGHPNLVTRPSWPGPSGPPTHSELTLAIPLRFAAVCYGPTPRFHVTLVVRTSIRDCLGSTRARRNAYYQLKCGGV